MKTGTGAVFEERVGDFDTHGENMLGSLRNGNRRFRAILGNMGIVAILQNAGADTDERVLGNAELGEMMS